MNPVTVTTIGAQDLHLFREGSHTRLYEKLGCHLHATGARFAVWAPNARSVSIVGDFNDWDAQTDRAYVRGDGSGLWELDIAGVQPGQRYKFAIITHDGARLDKADPFATRTEPPPATASVAWAIDDYAWNDAAWLAHRAGRRTAAGKTARRQSSAWRHLARPASASDAAADNAWRSRSRAGNRHHRPEPD